MNMKQRFYIKSLLIAMFVLFGGGSVSAEEETFYSENFGTASTEVNLTTYNDNWSASGYAKVQSNTRNGNSGRALQMGSKNSPGAEVITPILSETLPSNVSFTLYLYTGNKNNESVTLSVVGGGTIKACSGATSTLSDNKVTVTFKSNSYWYKVTLTLNGCTPQTKIKIKNLRTLYVDNITVTGDADQRTPVTLEYSTDKYTTATESGEITDAPTLTVTPAEAASEVVFSSSDGNVAYFDEDGKLIAVAEGTTTITASISGSETYRDAETSYTLKVGLASSNLRYNPTSVTVTYGDNFTAPTLSYTGGYDGTITYTSDNPSVATVDANGVVTILAVGVTKITASGAATQYLKASKASFTLTVNDIQGSATGGTGGSLFHETFDKINGTGGNDGAWSGGIASTGLILSGNDKNVDEDGWGFTYGYGGYMCARIGASKNNGSATTREIAVTAGQNYNLTFKAASWAGEDKNKLDVSITGGSITGIPDENLTEGEWKEYSATITPTSNAITITFTVPGKKRFFLDEINVAAPSTSETVNVTIPSSGWGTYCCQWPLDLTAASSPEGLKAYAVSSTSSSEATLTQITEKIIGGTGIIINGTPGTTYTLNVADKGTAYSGTNLLTGTLARTYIEEGQYFLKSGKFVYSSAGTLPANKAYLKSDGTGTQGAKLSFVFDTTSIEQVKVETSDAWYDLSGRKVNPSANVKGVYIHNGKKVVK
jgi:hypothetical protein